MAGQPLQSSMALVRSAGHILRQGRQLLENILQKNTDNIIGGLPKRKLPGKIDKENLQDGTVAGFKGENAFPRICPPGGGRAAAAARSPAAAAAGRRGRWLWSDGLGGYLARTTTRTLAAELRRKAALQFGTRTPVVRRAFGYRRTPLYAFVGLGLGVNSVGGEGSVEGDEEGFGHVCSQIKEMFTPASKFSRQETALDPEVGRHLEDYVIGPMIAKGCNSAVYPARLIETNRKNLKTPEWEVIEHQTSNHHQRSRQGQENPIAVPMIEDFSDDESESSMVTSREISPSNSLSNDVTFISEAETSSIINNDSMSDIMILDDDDDVEMMKEDKVYESETSSDQESEDGELDNFYPLAIKMMFNYDAESTAYSIIRSMQNEAVPAKMADSNTHTWENGSYHKKKRLKTHPNIVDMFGIFVDDVPKMPDSLREYPDALPERLNPEGSGRNKTMFIVMKRYETTLRQYLSENDVSVRESTVLFCQLVEAILHMTQEGVAHRDLKSDNILVEGKDQYGHLVVTDFGCCLADPELGLRVPYYTDDITKGGNGTLMAPEIATAHPGHRRYLDYRKSDLWAAGTLAYEIFGAENPFYRGADGCRLETCTYRSKNLPSLPDDVPPHLRRLIRLMLRRKPSARPDVPTVANALHVLLWGPPEWRLLLAGRGPPPGKVEVIRWLLTLSAGVMCQRSGQSDAKHIDYSLKCLFLARLNFTDVMAAIDFVWSLV